MFEILKKIFGQPLLFFPKTAWPNAKFFRNGPVFMIFAGFSDKFAGFNNEKKDFLTFSQ